MTRYLFLSLSLLVIAVPAQAQLISVKTIPIAQADQFQLFPSRNIGMGGVSIALADTVADIGGNPAKGARLATSTFFSSPYGYVVTRDAGTGRTLPLGAAARIGNWFGGFSGAFQQLDVIDAQRAPDLRLDVNGRAIPTDNGSQENQFAFGSLGRTLSHGGWSFGASGFWADIHAIDAVDRLYANSQSVRQSGSAIDVRVGALKEWNEGHSFEAVMLHNRLAMTHDVTFADQFFDPAAARTMTRGRVERNVDHTNVWGLHFGYERPLDAPGLRFGAILTANHMSHPKIPEYRILQVVETIPWDPGHTNGFNLGVGISKNTGPATLAADFIVEPIWTHTWGEAQGEIVNRDGVTIPAGGRTVENWFRFRNATVRMGLDRQVHKTTNLQFGLSVHTVFYKFWQTDHVLIVGRHQEEGWIEWSPTWGLRVRLPEMELRYQGRVTLGLGRPGPLSSGGGRIANRAVADVSVAEAIVSPPSEGSVSMGGVSLFHHLFSLSFPLGAAR